MKTFGDFKAVDGISFSVGEGTIRAFLGPNGAGKTTTIKMLTTVLAPTSGRITVAGHDPVRERTRCAALSASCSRTRAWTKNSPRYENMQLHGVLYGVPRAALRERMEALLRFVGLWDRRNDYVKEFSGGMKRRLEIARAFLHQPRLLFLDEPTLGLDPQTRSHIWEFVRGLSREHQVTVFFTTHAMEEAERVADDITMIDHGRIVAEGTADSLKERTGTAHAGGSVHRADRARHPRGRGDAGRPDAHAAPRLGSAADARGVDPVAAADQALLAGANADDRRARPADPVPVRAGLRIWPDLARAGGGNYLEFVVPGIIAMGIIFNAVFGGIEIIWDRQFGFLKETLVAPVPRLAIVLGRTLGGATTAMLQGVIVLVICVIAGFRIHHPLLVPLALVFMFLIALVFAAIGTAIGSVLRDMQGFQLIMNFLVMPLFFFSNALFPMAGLPAALRLAVRLNPLSYGVAGMRDALAGAASWGMVTDLAVLGGMAAVLLGVSSFLFSRIEA